MWSPDDRVELLCCLEQGLLNSTDNKETEWRQKQSPIGFPCDVILYYVFADFEHIQHINPLFHFQLRTGNRRF